MRNGRIWRGKLERLSKSRTKILNDKRYARNSCVKRLEAEETQWLAYEESTFQKSNCHIHVAGAWHHKSRRSIAHVKYIPLIPSPARNPTALFGRNAVHCSRPVVSAVSLDSSLRTPLQYLSTIEYRGSKVPESSERHWHLDSPWYRLVSFG